MEYNGKDEDDCVPSSSPCSTLPNEFQLTTNDHTLQSPCILLPTPCQTNKPSLKHLPLALPCQSTDQIPVTSPANLSRLVLASPSNRSSPYPSEPLISPISQASHDPQMDSDPDSFILYLGCDSNEEEEEDELRNIKESSKEQIKSVLPDLKLPGKFTLTPVHTRKEDEESGDVGDLKTPYQCLSASVDCPERPVKTHRTSISQSENATSCRLLFSGTAAVLEEGNDHTATNKQSTASQGNDEAETQPTQPNECVFKDIDILPASIHSPSSSSCSDCVPCSSDSSPSFVLPCILPSPVLAQIKPTSQTIISSPEEDDQAIDEVLKPLTTCVLREVDIKDSADVETQDSGVNDKVLSVPEAFAVAANVPQQVSPAQSSTGSIHSNWTVISGVSPLPSSDPTHLHYYQRHHHHHHHRHHHHHHHHHQSTGCRNIKAHVASDHEENLVTSTPIHQKCVMERMDVSSVTSTSSQDCLPEARFVMSWELAEAQCITEWNDGRGSTVSGPPSSDKENADPYSGMFVLPTRLDTVRVESSGLKRSRECLDEFPRCEETDDLNAKKTRGKVDARQINKGNEMEVNGNTADCRELENGQNIEHSVRKGIGEELSSDMIVEYNRNEERDVSARRTWYKENEEGCMGREGRIMDERKVRNKGATDIENKEEIMDAKKIKNKREGPTDIERKGIVDARKGRNEQEERSEIETMDEIMNAKETEKKKERLDMEDKEIDSRRTISKEEKPKQNTENKEMVNAKKVSREQIQYIENIDMANVTKTRSKGKELAQTQNPTLSENEEETVDAEKGDREPILCSENIDARNVTKTRSRSKLVTPSTAVIENEEEMVNVKKISNRELIPFSENIDATNVTKTRTRSKLVTSNAAVIENEEEMVNAEKVDRELIPCFETVDVTEVTKKRSKNKDEMVDAEKVDREQTPCFETINATKVIKRRDKNKDEMVDAKKINKEPIQCFENIGTTNVKNTRMKSRLLTPTVSTDNTITLIGQPSQGRPMYPREIRELAATPVNIHEKYFTSHNIDFSKDYMEFEDLSPRHSPTLDDSLYRPVTPHDSHLSVTLE